MSGGRPPRIASAAEAVGRSERPLTGPSLAGARGTAARPDRAAIGGPGPSANGRARGRGGIKTLPHAPGENGGLYNLKFN